MNERKSFRITQRMMVIGLEMKETTVQYKLKPCKLQGLERDVVQDPWIVIKSPWVLQLGDLLEVTFEKV